MNPVPTLPAYSDDSLARLGATELTELMIRDEDRVPRNVIDRCAAHGEEMVGHLRTAFEAEDAWRPELPLGEWWLRLHAVMILGLIASESAGLLLVQLMRQMSLAQDDDLQDWLAGHWPALFRNKPLPAVETARALCEDRTLDWYIRCQGAGVVVDASTRESGDALDSALDWIAHIAADEGEDWYMRLAAGNTLLDFPRERHRALLNDLAARQKGPGAQFSREAVEEACAKGYDEPDWKRFKDPWKFYTPGAIARRQDRWAEEADTDGDEPGVPYVRPTEKIGRNDPCPCGSGRKYKKCCLPRESA